MAHILVADDDPILRATAGAYLADAGHTVSEASDGTEALEALSQSSFDLLIVDMLMPETDGLEVILQIRRTDQTLPILAISSGGRMDISSLLTPAAAFGATATMSKPLLRAPLLKMVQRLLSEEGAA
jgi:CheY-like chemotaxis protein